MKKNLILLISIAILLSACAPAATYKPYGNGSTLTGKKEIGYRSAEIEKGKWLVQYLASTSQDEIAMIKFSERYANSVGKKQCHNSYEKSQPTIHSESIANIQGSIAGLAITKKSINILVTCR